MTPKTLEPKSEYAKYDTDGDGVVSDEELSMSERLQFLEVLHEKHDSQRNICYVCIAGMMLYPSLVVISDMFGLTQAAEILGSMSGVYYVSVAGLVSVWFGTSTWANRNNKK